MLDGADRWGRAHIASLSFHSVINLRLALDSSKGTFIYDITYSFSPIDCLLIQGCQPLVQNIIEINKQKRSNPQHCKKRQYKGHVFRESLLKKTIKILVFLSFV